ncbi:uncharacterized protein [Typha angustifolia]|uniref:uncharacterized protein n=1 Tax=Typha angustifolia TaxID=59011 RepID=UPI003C30BA13
MNHAIKAALFGGRPSSSPSLLMPVSLFHSTQVLERKRKKEWHSRFNYYAKRRRNRESKRIMLRDISDYAEYLFQSWRDEEERSTSNGGPSWFRGHHWVRGTKRNGFHSQGPKWSNFNNKRQGGLESSSSDDEEVETIFQSTFGRERYSYWSFSSSGNVNWRDSSKHAYQERSRSWHYETDDETDSSPSPELASERLALGLSLSGPLKLEDVKSAYRACALRWHPDRHHGSSKVAAEEKFKHCSAAYKTLCDKLFMG